MKYIKNIGFILAISLLGSVSGFSQIHIMGLGEFIDYANIDRTNPAAVSSYIDIKGSPFFNDEFIVGRLKLRNGKTYEGPLRYDIYSDQIEFKTENGEIYAVQNPEIIERISLNKSEFICIGEENDFPKGIYEVLGTGKYVLYEKHMVELKDRVPPKPYVDAKPATFTKKASAFFLLNPNGEVIPLNSKKDLAALNQEKGVGDYLKKNKLKTSDKDDVLKLVEFLNSL